MVSLEFASSLTPGMSWSILSTQEVKGHDQTIQHAEDLY